MWGVWWWPCQEPDWVCTSLLACHCSRTALSWLLPSTNSLPDLSSCISDHMSTTTRNSLYVDTHAHTSFLKHNNLLFHRSGNYDLIITQSTWNRKFANKKQAYLLTCSPLVPISIKLSPASPHVIAATAPWLCLILPLYSEWHLHSRSSSLVPSLTAVLSRQQSVNSILQGGDMCKHGKHGPGYN